MSKIRWAITPIAAIAGAQLMSLVTIQATAHSDETGCRPGYYQLGDINRLAEATGRQIRDDARGYPRVDSVSIQASPSPQPVAVESSDASPSVAPIAAAASPLLDNDGSTTESIWAHEQRLPTKAEESDYQSLRLRHSQGNAPGQRRPAGENVAL